MAITCNENDVLVGLNSDMRINKKKRKERDSWDRIKLSKFTIWCVWNKIIIHKISTFFKSVLHPENRRLQTDTNWWKYFATEEDSIYVTFYLLDPHQKKHKNEQCHDPPPVTNPTEIPPPQALGFPALWGTGSSAGLHYIPPLPKPMQQHAFISPLCYGRYVIQGASTAATESEEKEIGIKENSLFYKKHACHKW